MFKLEYLKNSFEQALARSLHQDFFDGAYHSKRLNRAMAYALSSPGKRLRPLLVLASALTQADEKDEAQIVKQAMPAALAVEYVHTYSLIHDDLPAMDDDDFRRDKPSTHRQFNEGQAILAGDALLADAFFLLSTAKYNASAQCRELALTAGRHGLPAGQAEDLALKGTGSLKQWLAINQAKTARLFEACAVLGVLSTGIDPKNTALWRQLGHNFGVAFQIKDDIDDKTGASDSTADLPGIMVQHIKSVHDFAKDQPNNEALFEFLGLTSVKVYAKIVSSP